MKHQTPHRPHMFFQLTATKISHSVIFMA